MEEKIIFVDEDGNEIEMYDIDTKEDLVKFKQVTPY